jgi:hypothetical protein
MQISSLEAEREREKEKKVEGSNERERENIFSWRKQEISASKVPR